MEKMKQIQNKEDFLKWANDVNFSTDNKRSGIWDLQDIFARSGNGNMDELKAMFLDVTNTEKQLLTFSIAKAMGEETAYRFIKAWAKRQANIVIEEQQKDIEEEYQKIAKDRMDFLKEKRTFDLVAPTLKKEIEELKELLNNSRINNDGLHKTISRLEERNTVLNDELGRVYDELNETMKFRKYLKSVINSNEI
jgi:hypothetical protein